jgi:hypothetical protein
MGHAYRRGLGFRFTAALLFTACLTCASAAEPEEAAPAPSLSSTTATAPAAAAPAGTALSSAAPASAGPAPHAAEIKSTIKHLSFLLEEGRRTDAAKLDAAAAELAALDTKIKDLLGSDLLRLLENREMERAAKAALMRLRAALLVCYTDREGAYPASLEELVPRYLPAIPALELPGHSASASATAAAGDPAAAVTDTGGWLYFGASDASNAGLLLNCSHKDTNGNELYKY